MRYDFHTHTTASDGIYSPEQVVKIATKKGLDGIAITDHDTIDGIIQARNFAREYKDDFQVLNGIEFSCSCNDEEVHILGYDFDMDNDEMIKISESLKVHRRDRILKMVAKLKEDLNLDISFENVQALSKGGALGRPHIARELVNLGYCSTIEDAFKLYLKKGCPGYVPRFKLDIEDVIGIIRRAGGVSVLAHPGLINDKYIINQVVDWGIDGIEVYHPKNGPTESKKMKRITKEKNLIYTAGSDFHGCEKKIGETIDIGNYFIETDLSIREWIRQVKGVD